MLVISSKQDQCAMLMEEALRRIANHFPNQDLSKDLMVRKFFGRAKICSVLDVFVSDDQGFMCIDIEASSPVHNTAQIRIRISHGVAHRERQSSEFAPELKARIQR